MSNFVYVLSFAPDGDYSELFPLDGFNTIIGVYEYFENAVDGMKEELDGDETIIDFDLHRGDFDYFYTKYGCYRIQKIGLTP